MPKTQREIKCTEAEFQRRTGITRVIGLYKCFYNDALRVFADKFGRTESTVYHVIGMVSQFFFDQQSYFITMPRTQREIKCTEAEFQRRSGITGVIGAINKSHWRLTPKNRTLNLIKLTAV
jgi:hypothetical protein